MRISDYTEAAHTLIKAGSDLDVVISRLKKSLCQKGLQKWYPRVLKGISEKFRQTRDSDTPVVVVARKADATKFHDMIHKHIDKEFITEIDETLIGGYIINTSDIRIDCSYKSILHKIYQRISN